MITNAAAKAASAQPRAYKMFDTGGLFLFVAPTGTKSWRLKYRWRGREKLLTIGRFPELNIAQARMRREEAKALLVDNVDPAGGGDMKVNTLEQLARSWISHNRSTWSPSHAADVIGSLERDVLPAIGDRPVDQVAPRELLAVLQAVEARGCAPTAQRLRQRLSEIYAFGIAQGRASSDPAAKLGAAMRDAPPSTPHPALTDIGDCRALIAACAELAARPMTQLASRFLALTAVRLDAVRGARWSEIEDLDGDAPLWRVPAARMKLARAKKGEERFDHLVPLSPAAIDVLRAARKVSRSDGLIFPGRARSAPIGEGAIRELYIRAGFAGRHVPHGWRSSFSTILNEQLGEGWRSAIDRALAHSPKDKVEAAYNRAQLLDRRRELLERWAALLIG